MIQIHVDLVVDPRKEADMLEYFATVFRPAAEKFQGYRDVRMLKLRAALMGEQPLLNYRFVIIYENEELRQKWVTSAIHQEVWGGMEKTLSSPNYPVFLFDVAERDS